MASPIEKLASFANTWKGLAILWIIGLVLTALVFGVIRWFFGYEEALYWTVVFAFGPLALYGALMVSVVLFLLALLGFLQFKKRIRLTAKVNSKDT